MIYSSCQSRACQCKVSSSMDVSRFLPAINSSQSLAIELPGANSGDWSHGSTPVTPPKICHQPRTLEGKELDAHRPLWPKKVSCCLLRLPASRPKSILLKTPFSSSALSSVLHPPSAASTSHGTFPSSTTIHRFVPTFTTTTFTSLPERPHRVGSCRQGIREIIHTHIHSVRSMLLLRLGASCGNTLPCA